MIAAGGTGGSVYPALAVAEAMRVRHPKAKLAFVGAVGGFEGPLVAESGVVLDSYDEVRSGPLHGVGFVKAASSLVSLLVGTVQAFGLVRRRKPGALLLTGGWVGFPAAVAAWLLRVPILIFLPDIEPGLTIQVLRRFAKRVAVTVPDSQAYFPAGKTVVTGYPLRAGLHDATREDARVHFNLDPQRPVLLVFGGSRGARSINHALLAILTDLLVDGTQVLHISGTLDWADVEAQREALGSPADYHAFDYLHDDMGLALAAADLVVSRAGASILGEFPFFAVASILIPYPYAWRYQKVNADYLVERGAAVRLDDARMDEDLLPTIRGLLNDAGRLATMRDKAAQLAVPDAAGRIADELAQLSGDSSG